MTSAAQPFVLLDDARPGGRATLYSKPSAFIETRAPAEVRDCLARLRGRHAAGFITYEAGHALEPKLAPLTRAAAPEEPPLLWFGLFERTESVDAAEFLPDPAGAWAGAVHPRIREAPVAQSTSHRHTARRRHRTLCCYPRSSLRPGTFDPTAWRFQR